MSLRAFMAQVAEEQASAHGQRSQVCWRFSLKGGVRIGERQGALLHSTTALIAAVCSCVGSSNLDWRSFLDNDEINVVVLGREFGQQMQAMFAKDLDASVAIDPATWEGRSPMLRVKEWGASLGQRLL